jgi:hypothetical protein
MVVGVLLNTFKSPPPIPLFGARTLINYHFDEVYNTTEWIIDALTHLLPDPLIVLVASCLL